MRDNATRHYEGGDKTDCTDSEPNERDVRAVTEYLSVLEDVGPAADAPGLYYVVSQSGENYVVDARGGTCECPDAQYRAPEGGCKHVRRVEIALGERPVPAGVDRDDVDDQLGQHVDGHHQVATDGGSDIIVAGDDAEILTDDVDDGRPDDCQCWDADLDLPCWPCYREGFEEPNPETPAADNGGADGE